MLKLKLQNYSTNTLYILLKKLGLFTKEQSAISTENSLSKVEIAISEHGNHPGITAITEKMEKLGNPTFGFHFT